MIVSGAEQLPKVAMRYKKTTMRYEKSQALLRLAFEMQGSAEGISLRDIMEKSEVSRRTAERMRDAVREVFSEVEEVDLGDGFKRWRIRVRRNGMAVPISADELATLHSAASRLRADGRNEQAGVVDGLAAKLRSLILPDVLRRIEPDYEALVEAEGLALRPGPRPRVANVVMRELREAVKGCEVVRLHYRARSTGLLGTQTVHPYGFLYGNRHYLVGFNAGAEVPDFHLFSLANIEKIERLSECFNRDPSFSMEEYANRSFGVFQEKPVNVVWRVMPEAAAEAREVLFHPTQTIEEQSDGSLIVRFAAGGLLEMCRYLFAWRGAIQVVEPVELVDIIRRELDRFQAALPKSDCLLPVQSE